MYRRKTWREKMANPNLPKVVAIPPNMQRQLGKGTLVLPSPYVVEEFLRGVPEGHVITVSRLRRLLAAHYGTTSACPLVTGIIVRIVAEAAEEDARAGKTTVTPYWRVVKEDGSLYPKFPGGIAAQAERLRDEGLTVVKGKVRAPGLCQTGKHEPPPLPGIAHRRRGARAAG